MAKHHVLRAADTVQKAFAGLSGDEVGLVLQLVQRHGAAPAKRKYRKRATPATKRSVRTLKKQLKKNADKTTPQARSKGKPVGLVD